MTTRTSTNSSIPMLRRFLRSNVGLNFFLTPYDVMHVYHTCWVFFFFWSFFRYFDRGVITRYPILGAQGFLINLYRIGLGSGFDWRLVGFQISMDWSFLSNHDFLTFFFFFSDAFLKTSFSPLRKNSARFMTTAYYAMLSCNPNAEPSVFVP